MVANNKLEDVYEDLQDFANMSRYISKYEPSEKKIYYSIARKMEKKFLRKCLEKFSGIKLTDKDRRKMRKSLRIGASGLYKPIVKFAEKYLSGVYFAWPVERIYVRKLEPETLVHECAHWLDFNYRRENPLKMIKNILKYGLRNYKTVMEAYADLAEVNSLNILSREFPERTDEYETLSRYWKEVVKGSISPQLPEDYLIADFLRNYNNQKHVSPEEFYKFAIEKL